MRKRDERWLAQLARPARVAFRWAAGGAAWGALGRGGEGQSGEGSGWAAGTPRPRRSHVRTVVRHARGDASGASSWGHPACGGGPPCRTSSVAPWRPPFLHPCLAAGAPSPPPTRTSYRPAAATTLSRSAWTEARSPACRRSSPARQERGGGGGGPRARARRRRRRLVPEALAGGQGGGSLAGCGGC